MDNSCYFPPMWLLSAYQTETTADLSHYNSHSQWSIITQNKTRAGCKKKKSIISAVFVKIAWLYVKIVPLFPAAFLKNKRDKYDHFPNFSPISCCSLAFHFTVCYSLFIDETEAGAGGHYWQELTCTCVCVCVIYSDVDFTLCIVYRCRQFPLEISFQDDFDEI